MSSLNLVNDFVNKGINVLAVERKGSDGRPEDGKESSSGDFGIKFEKLSCYDIMPNIFVLKFPFFSRSVQDGA